MRERRVSGYGFAATVNWNKASWTWQREKTGNGVADDAHGRTNALPVNLREPGILAAEIVCSVGLRLSSPLRCSPVPREHLSRQGKEFARRYDAGHHAPDRRRYPDRL